MQKYYKISDVQSKLNHLRNHGIQRGEYCGFEGLDEIYTAKKGYPLFIAGAPHSGKTEVTLELLMAWSEIYGWKHCVCLGENGDPEDIFAELCSKYIGKSYRKMKEQGVVNQYAMTEVERTQAEYFVSEHFIVIGEEFEFNFDTDKNADVTIKSFYKYVSDVEKELGYQFDTTTFDPFNDIDEEDEKYGGRIDRYLKYALRYVRSVSRNFKRIDILVTHIADLKPREDPKTGQRYYPMAMPNEWAGGRVWFRRGFTMLLIYRPPAGHAKNLDGTEFYTENETMVVVQKAKPKGAAKLGARSLYFDWERNRFYEMLENGERRYAGKRTKATEQSGVGSTIKPNAAFDSEYDPDRRIEPTTTPDTDMPF
ncbi:hypothetical protein DRO66_08075 [Candidatus Bathyarchaeota archaeon]|nr:MAG: hypothetical protein DRO66_08075 [Candidatus Bathyarchaeota archaeon]